MAGQREGNVPPEISPDQVRALSDRTRRLARDLSELANRYGDFYGQEQAGELMAAAAYVRAARAEINRHRPAS